MKPWIVQHAFYNSHGLASLQKTHFYSLSEARTELAAEIRARRKLKRFYIVRNGLRSFYVSDPLHPMGVYQTLSVVASVPEPVHFPCFQEWLETGGMQS